MESHSAPPGFSVLMIAGSRAHAPPANPASVYPCGADGIEHLFSTNIFGARCNELDVRTTHNWDHPFQAAGWSPFCARISSREQTDSLMHRLQVLGHQVCISPCHFQRTVTQEHFLR